MNQEDIREALDMVLNNYAYGNWQNVVSYYGTDLANQLDFIDEFDYEEVYQRGNVKECAAFYNIAIIQRCIVACLFNLNQNEEALKTFNTLDYLAAKLFDRATGVNEHTWLN